LSEFCSFLTKLDFFLTTGEIFDMLDVDGGGEVSIDEFCEQIVKSVTCDRPIELTRILKLVRGVPNLQEGVAKEVARMLQKGSGSPDSDDSDAASQDSDADVDSQGNKRDIKASILLELPMYKKI
jgi:hypothetical protein